MKKFCCVAMMKSGTHIIRHLWDIVGHPSLRHFSNGSLGMAMDGWRNKQFIMGHIGRAQDVEDVLRDREVWLLTRDPRNCIVSLWYWQSEHKNHTKSYEWCIKEIGRQGRGIVKWKDYENVEIFSFEDLILNPESTAKRMSDLMDMEQWKITERLKYRGGKTYRKGKVGGFGKDFPNDLWELYEEECKEIRHWEHNVVS